VNRRRWQRFFPKKTHQHWLFQAGAAKSKIFALAIVFREQY